MKPNEPLQKGARVILALSAYSDYYAATYIAPTGQRELMGSTYHRLRVIDEEGDYETTRSTNNFWVAEGNWATRWEDYASRERRKRKATQIAKNAPPIPFDD